MKHVVEIAVGVALAPMVWDHNGSRWLIALQHRKTKND